MTGATRRDIAVYETILSGDIGAPGAPSDNCYHVVTGSATDETAVLDGFTVTDGNANGSWPRDTGGGMYSSSGQPDAHQLHLHRQSGHKQRRRDAQLEQQQPHAYRLHVQRQLGPLGRRDVQQRQ